MRKARIPRFFIHTASRFDANDAPKLELWGLSY